MTKTARTNIGRKAPDASSGLVDAELVLLASGGQRPDRLIEAPVTMKTVTHQRAGANLIRRGLVEERPADRSEPVWREEDGQRLALWVTAAGLAAIGIETADKAGGAPTTGPAPDRPREGTKGALLIGMLTRPEGAGIDELIAATGWLPHTTRAALTGLRKRGYEVGRDRDPDGRSRYRIATATPAPAAPARRGRKPRATEARAAA